MSLVTIVSIGLSGDFPQACHTNETFSSLVAILYVRLPKYYIFPSCSCVCNCNCHSSVISSKTIDVVRCFQLFFLSRSYFLVRRIYSTQLVEGFCCLALGPEAKAGVSRRIDDAQEFVTNAVMLISRSCTCLYVFREKRVF